MRYSAINELKKCLLNLLNHSKGIFSNFDCILIAFNSTYGGMQIANQAWNVNQALAQSALGLRYALPSTTGEILMSASTEMFKINSQLSANTKKKILLTAITSALATALSVPVSNANAGATINFGEDKSITVGLGLRAAYTNAEDGSPSGNSRSDDFDVYSARIFTSASLNKYIKGTLNIDATAGAESSFGSARNGVGDKVQVFDAIAQFEFAPEFNIWAGRMLVPNDRGNMDGPYYLSTWLYPALVAQYPGQTNGRDTGVTAWGKLNDAHFTYAAGAFEGHNNFKGASSEDSNLMYATRLQYDFWDANPVPAYFTASTLYGAKEILAVALAANYQKDGVGTSANKGDYLGYNIDVLMEKDIGVGVLALEGAIYKFDSDGVSDVNTGLATSTLSSPGSTANVGGVAEGKAYLASAAFLFPQKIGWGKFQPTVRYMKFDADSTTGDGVNSVNVASSDTKQYDLGVNYIIEGHNARLSAVYSKTKRDVAGASDIDLDKFVVGVQLQF